MEGLQKKGARLSWRKEGLKEGVFVSLNGRVLRDHLDPTPPFTDGETKAWRRAVTCSTTTSGLCSKPTSPNLQASDPPPALTSLGASIEDRTQGGFRELNPE